LLEWDPKEYRNYSTPQFKSGLELASRLETRGDESILDIGCGDGKITVYLSRLVPRGRVVGIDNSPEMIAFASKRYPPRKHPNVSWKVMDASRLSFKDDFDIVFSNACLHWIADHRPLLAGIHKSLKSRGRLFVQMRGASGPGPLETSLVETLQEGDWLKYFSKWSFNFGFYGPEEYRLLLLEAGFRPLRVELVTRMMTFRGREGLVGHILSTWLPFTQPIPSELRERFVHEVVNRYLEKVPLEENGRALYPSRRLVVEAEKNASPSPA
jgi:trans-aconitate methyltransferase